jgi:hypothetical protein
MKPGFFFKLSKQRFRRRARMKKNVALLYSLCLLGLLISCQKSFSSEKNLPQSSSGSIEVQKTDEEEIKRVIIARGDAFAAGKCEEFESYVTPDVIEIEGGLVTPHEVLTKECRGRNAIPDFKQESFRSDFQFQFLGDVVVVTYIGKKIEHIGELTPIENFRGVDVLKKQNGKWLLSVFTFVPRYEDPPPRKISAAQLDEYVGRYVWVGAPKMIDTVTQDGGKLYLQSTGDDSRTELIWEAGDTFAFHGAPDRVTFERDKNQKVVDEFRPGLRARKNNRQLDEGTGNRN